MLRLLSVRIIIFLVVGVFRWGFLGFFFVEKIDVFIPRFVPSAKTDSIILLIRGRS